MPKQIPARANVSYLIFFMIDQLLFARNIVYLYNYYRQTCSAQTDNGALFHIICVY